MARFRCHDCGEIHEGFPELGFSSPDYYLALAEPDRESAELSDDLCQIGNDYFIRCCLPLPIQGTEESYNYGIWLSVSQQNFRRYIEHLNDHEQNIGDRYVGYVSNNIPLFENTMDLIGAAAVNKAYRPLVELEPVDHPLVSLQQVGINEQQLSRIVADYLH